MEWYENEDRAMFAETARKFADFTLEHIDGEAMHERTGPLDFDWKIIERAGQAGVSAAPLPEEMGGAGLGRLGRAVVLERLGMGMAGVAAVIGVHWAGLCALAGAADDKAVLSWLTEAAAKSADEKPPLCGVASPLQVVDDGDPVTPELEERDSGYRLKGRFICPVHPGVLSKVMAPAYGEDRKPVILCLEARGLLDYIEPAYPGTGLLETPMAGLKISEKAAGAEDIIAEAEKARASLLEIKRELYANFAAIVVGNAAAAASYARQYSSEREQTGRPIILHQDVARVIEDMDVRVEAARDMLFTAAAVEDPVAGEARTRRAFLFIAGVGESVCLDAIQALGGYGYMKDYGLERRLRDAKTLQVLLGGHARDWIGAGW